MSFANCIHQCNHHSKQHKSLSSKKPCGSFVVSPFPVSHCLKPLPDFYHLRVALSVFRILVYDYSCGLYFFISGFSHLPYCFWDPCMLYVFFLLLSRNESIIRIQHSPVDDHLHGFHFLTIINMAKSILILDGE